MDKETMNKKTIKEPIDNEDLCDIYPDKVCDSCGKCLEEDKNYKIIKITKIITKE